MKPSSINARLTTWCNNRASSSCPGIVVGRFTPFLFRLFSFVFRFCISVASCFDFVSHTLAFCLSMRTTVGRIELYYKQHRQGTISIKRRNTIRLFFQNNRGNWVTPKSHPVASPAPFRKQYFVDSRPAQLVIMLLLQASRPERRDRATGRQLAQSCPSLPVYTHQSHIYTRIFSYCIQKRCFPSSSNAARKNRKINSRRGGLTSPRRWSHWWEWGELPQWPCFLGRWHNA